MSRRKRRRRVRRDSGFRRSLEGARARVGRTGTARARWLLDWAARARDVATAGDLSNLQVELEVFLANYRGPASAEAWVSPDEPFLVREEHVREWSAWLRDGLDSLKVRKPWDWTFAAKTTYNVSREIAPIGTVAGKAPRDLFVAAVAYTLLSEWRRLRFCQECTRPFIARMRQAYCTARCSQSYRTRKFLERHRGRGTRRRKGRPLAEDTCPSCRVPAYHGRCENCGAFRTQNGRWAWTAGAAGAVRRNHKRRSISEEARELVEKGRRPRP